MWLATMIRLGRSSMRLAMAIASAMRSRSLASLTRCDASHRRETARRRPR
jgi:hypothetical protein